MKKMVMFVLILSSTQLVRASAPGLPGPEPFSPQMGPWGPPPGSEMRGALPYSTFVPGAFFHSVGGRSPYPSTDPREQEIHRLNFCLYQAEGALAGAHGEVFRLSGLLAALQSQVDRLNGENVVLQEQAARLDGENKKLESDFAKFSSVAAIWGCPEWSVSSLLARQPGLSEGEISTESGVDDEAQSVLLELINKDGDDAFKGDANG